MDIALEDGKILEFWAGPDLMKDLHRLDVFMDCGTGLTNISSHLRDRIMKAFNPGYEDALRLSLTSSKGLTVLFPDGGIKKYTVEEIEEVVNRVVNQ